MIKKIRNYLSYLICLISYGIDNLISLFVRNKAFYKDLWIIAERKTDARDNGYHFFRYICEFHPEINCAYIISKNSPDYNKVFKIGTVILPGSLRHKLAFVLAKAKISTHVMGYAPDTYRFSVLDRIFNIVKGRKILLQHGIATCKLTELFFPASRLDLLVCTSLKEYRTMLEHYGHPDGVVQRIGLCRYDRLLSEHEVKKQILVMPTWRYYLRAKNNEEFKKSDYYKNYNNLINNPRLIKLLNDYGYEIKLYLHYELQPFSKLFEEKNKRVHVMTMGTADVQDLLMSSALLITDFSSVFFDFAYMNKPLCYWQFDEEKFYQTQYERGDFDFRTDGFGPFEDGNNSEKIIDFIEYELKNNMAVKKQYQDNIDKYFSERTTGHCEKTFEAINKLLKDNE